MQYYGLPVVSMRAAVHRLMSVGIDGFKVTRSSMLLHGWGAPAAQSNAACFVAVLQRKEMRCQQQQGALSLPILAPSPSPRRRSTRRRPTSCRNFGNTSQVVPQADRTQRASYLYYDW